MNAFMKRRSIVNGVRQGKLIESEWFSNKYESVLFSSIGIPFEAQAAFTPSAYFGIGITGFANLNREESFYGGLLSLQIGNLR